MLMQLVIGLCLMAALVLPASAGEPQTINIWPGLAPGETTANPGEVQPDQHDNVTRLSNVTEPQLLVFRADGPGRHPAVLVFPGGGYGILAADLEGSDVARWLNGLGCSAFVLHYRVPNKREAAFQDAQRALSLLRSRSGEFGIDSWHIGVLGFSAGGHLAARLATGYDRRAYSAVDAVDKTSCRPDFALLIYPAYLMDKSSGQPVPEVKPHAGMPPVFLTQTRDDPYFDAADYADAVRQAGIAAECVLYDKGGHGYGLRLPADQPAHRWSAEAADWLRQQTH